METESEFIEAIDSKGRVVLEKPIVEEAMEDDLEVIQDCGEVTL